MGVDEAGRGPVIGPMVIAAVTVNSNQLPYLNKLGLKDSKLIKRSKRRKLTPIIENQIREVRFAVITPQQIDKNNINQIELIQIADLINRVSPDRVYFDLPVNPGGASRYHNDLRDLLGDQSIELIGENRADNKFSIVSAASILAKVKRDKNIQKLRSEYGDFGWGYPAEKKTRKFLLRCLEEKGSFPECVRKRWKTVKKIENLWSNPELPLNHRQKPENSQDLKIW